MSDEVGSGQRSGPSKWWYVGHLLFWVVTGLICYVLYKDTHPREARHHLITSIWLQMVVWAVLMVVFVVALNDYEI